MPQLIAFHDATGPVGDLAGPLAHAGGAGAHRWSALLVVVLVAGVAAGYGRGVHELWARRGASAVVPAWRVAAFAAGLGSVLLAESPAGQAAAERSFTGHMVQHMLLLVVAGPLLAAGGAGLPLTLAAPRPARRRLARLRAGAAGRWLRRPAVLVAAAGAGQTVALWAWHLPVPYTAAVDSPPVHALEHASLLAAAWLLWSVVLGPGRSGAAAPAGLLLLFGTGMPAAALGAVLTFAPAPLYPPRVLAPGGDPLADQQLAGLVMWIPMDVVVLAAAVTLFLRWLARLERAAPAGAELPPDSRSPDEAREVTIR